MDHGLVAGGDGGRVVQHHDVALKLPAGPGLQLGRDHDHALPDLRALDLLERERGRLAGLDLGDGHALPVDAPDCDLLEVAERIGAEQQGVVQADGALQVRAGDHGAHAGHGVRVVYLKLGGLQEKWINEHASWDHHSTHYTVYTSSSVFGVRLDSRFRNIFSKSRFSPDTFET